MSAIALLRGQIKTEEFDYETLMQALSQYKKPRDAITKLLRAGSILRIKKGLYIFGETYRRGVVCKESLANLIYGPSYVSLEYALSYYGLIPERVETVTSMTSLRNKAFQTPIGVFEYVHLNPKKMSVGIATIEADRLHQYLIATPEKALSDRIAFHKNLTTTEDIYSFVCEGLRIEEEALAKFQCPLMDEIQKVYRNVAVTQLYQLVKSLS